MKRVKPTKQGRDVLNKMRREVDDRISDRQLLDVLARQFCYLVRTNPRLSIVYKRIDKTLEGFSSADMFRIIGSLMPPLIMSREYAMESLIKKCTGIDKNFVSHYNKFNKLCGNKTRITDPAKLKAEIARAVARDSGKPKTFVSCGPNCVIRTVPLTERMRKQHVRDLCGKYKDVLPSSKQFIKDKEKEILMENGKSNR